MRLAQLLVKGLCVVILLSIVFVQAPAFAQTGAPPPVTGPDVALPDTVFPPGTVLVSPTILTVAPPGIDPLANPGAIFELPASGAPGGVAFVNPPFEDVSGNPIVSTFFVPMGPQPLIGRIEQIPLDELLVTGAAPQGTELNLPPELTGRTLIGFSLQIFSGTGSDLSEITDHEADPIVAAFPVTGPANAPILLHVDPETGEVTPVPFHIPEDDPTNTTGIVTNPDGTSAVVYDITDTTGFFILAV